MRRTALASGICLLVLLVAPVWLGVRAAQDPPPPLQFAMERVQLSWDRLQSDTGASIRLLSNAPRDQNVTIRPGDWGLKEANDGSTIATDTAIDISPRSLTLPAAGEVPLVLKAKNGITVKPGVYTGQLAAFDASSGAVARVPVQVLVLAPGMSVPAPVTNKWEVLSLRWLPVVGSPRWLWHRAIPVQAPDKGQELGVPAGALGAVEDDHGHAAEIQGDGTTDKLTGGYAGVQVKTSAINATGTYQGDIHLSPDTADKDTTVALTVTATDIVLWPALAIALGVGLALLVQRYLGVGRTLSQLRQEEAELGVQFHGDPGPPEVRGAQQDFAQTTNTHPYAAYSIATDFDIQRAAVRSRLATVNHSFFSKLDDTDPTYKGALDQLDKLKPIPDAWRAFGDELVALDTAVTALAPIVTAAAKPPVPAGTPPITEPLFLAPARALLSDAGPLDLPTFAMRRTAVQDATALAQAWGDLDAAIQRYRQWIAQLRSQQLNANQTDTLDAADAIVERAWWALWRSADASELNPAGLRGDLEDAEAKLASLNSVLGPDAAKAPPARWFNVFGQPDLINASSDARSRAMRVPTDDADRAQYYANWRRWRDFGLVAVAIVTAVATGLSQLYFGAPFGSLADYCGAFAWGFGTKVVVDGIATALDRVADLRRPVSSLIP